MWGYRRNEQYVVSGPRRAAGRRVRRVRARQRAAPDGDVRHVPAPLPPALPQAAAAATAQEEQALRLVCTLTLTHTPTYYIVPYQEKPLKFIVNYQKIIFVNKKQ